MDDQDQRREQMRKRQETIRERMSRALDQAVNDPGFRQKLLDDPKSVFGATKADADRQLPADVIQQRRELLQQVIDRAVSDPQFREQLKQDPRKALSEAGFGPKIEQLRAELPQEEVRAYTASWWGGSWIWSGLINPWGNWASSGTGWG